MAEEKPKSRAEGRYGKGAKEHERKGEERHVERAVEGRHDEKVGMNAMHGKHKDERDAMAKKHAKEHRELHGQHRDAMASMHSRQEGEMKDMMERHNQEMQAPAGNPDGDQDQMPNEGAPETE